MSLLECDLSGVKSLHDRYSLNYVANSECSYHSLMRFVSNSKHNWSLLMLLTAKAAISRIKTLNNKDHINTLWVDVTIIERARCKRAEGLCRTINHVIGKNVKGYTNLLVSWNDGYTSIPVAS